MTRVKDYVLEAPLIVERVEPSEVTGVYHVEFKSLEESPLLSFEVELPKQVLPFTRGDKVKVGISSSPIPWGQDADLYLGAKAFGVKQLEEGQKVYASAGGLQIRLLFKQPQPLKPLDKLYLAIQIIKEE